MTDNPYHSPQHGGSGAASAAGHLMTAAKGLAIVLATTVVGGLVGLGLGAALGVFVPDYYRSVFFGGRDPRFDPVAVGIGQGLTQGVVLGLVAGLAVVVIVCWYKTRLTRIERQ
jgi:hypothetical protein